MVFKIVPSTYRSIVLSLVHKTPVDGHFSHQKTAFGVRDHFYWPGMGSYIRDFCRSRDICQRSTSKSRVPPVPLKEMQGFPEALPLREINSVDIAEALLIFSRVGIPNE